MSCDYCDGTLVDKVFGGACVLCVPGEDDAEFQRRALGRRVDSWQDGTRFNGAGARSAVAASPAPARTNRYGGTCRRCAGFVAPQMGVLLREGSEWVVEHQPGQCSTAAPTPSRIEPRPVTQTVDVPDGRYALDTDDGVGFFVIEHGKQGGRWEGRIFVSQQAGDSVFPVKNPARRAAILEAIAVDPAAALARYGRELGVCGACGRTLTDEESRRIGIGPICRMKGGW